MPNEAKVFTKAEDGKLSTVIEYSTGGKIKIPINKDGSIRWFDDSQLMKRDGLHHEKVHIWASEK